MHFWFVLILFGSLLVQILSRPQQAAEYNNDSDLDEVDEDRENEPVAEEFLTDDEDSRLAEQEPAVQEEDLPQNHMLDQTGSRYLQRNPADVHLTRSNMDNVSGLKPGKNRDTRQDNPGATHFNEQVQSFPRRSPNRYTESNYEQQEATEHLSNRDVYKHNRLAQDKEENQVMKRTVEFEGQTDEEGDMLFEKNSEQVSKVNRNENNNNEGSDTSEQSRYFKQYYNTMQANTNEEKNHDGSARFNLRDRRDVKEASPADTLSMSNSQDTKESNDKTETEDEESAIKRHIKKLSGEELNQLLNSLTDDRRELLKKIIDDVDAGENGVINKREITKKAGAVEENNFIENCQSDLSKVQSGSNLEINTETAPSSSTLETTDISKPQEVATDRNELSTAKSTETSLSAVNKLELTNQNDQNVQKTADGLKRFAFNVDPKNQGKIVANVEVAPKTETKREANLDDIDDMSVDDSKTMDNDLDENGQDYANDQGYYSSRGESSSKLINDEPQSHEDGKEYKRETNLEKQSDLSDSMKSLEESFPNSNAYDDSAPYSGPLVRVKRKNSDQTVKKRSAGLFPDAKVGYFPYKAENEDEDEEGNEFDDEGFYDRTSNFANGNKGLEEEIANADQPAQARNAEVDNSKAAPHENVEGSDTMNLGSDTDGVLSGVEGVDDNLMYNNDARSRRTAEEDNSKDAAKDDSDQSPVLLENEKKSVGDNYLNAPHYQENDAFGPLPRNYDGDLNRYKRIRRVKQSHNAQEPTSSDG